MLKYVIANLFESPAQTLVNTVNTVGVMGKGIAAEFKRRYPEMFKKYREYCADGSLSIGKLFLYKTENKWVLNVPTKKHWRQPSKVEYVEQALQKFVQTYADHGITSISFPQLGTGNGGLDWRSQIRPLMERYLSDLTIPVFIHVAQRPADFTPEHLDPKLRRMLDSKRVAIGVVDFLRDLSEVAHVERVGRTMEDSDDETAEALPAVRLNSEVLIPGEEFAALWEDLELRRAVAANEFPPIIAQHAREVTRLLLQLGYIEPINFEANLPGIRFAPAADLNATASSVLARRETISR